MCISWVDGHSRCRVLWAPRSKKARVSQPETGYTTGCEGEHVTFCVLHSGGPRQNVVIVP
jgi:hypothetical protein